MDVKAILHMGKADGDCSYAEHSSLQRMIAAATKPVVESAVSSLFYGDSCYKVFQAADLGCAAGPNTFLFMKTVKEAVKKSCLERGFEIPEIQFYLNDLPGNDFNSLFKNLSSNCFEEDDGNGGRNVDGARWFAVATAGSFHDRLFLSNSLHFAHSSYSVHWLSKTPSGLINKQGVPVNKGNLYISKTSPPVVKKLYLDQFREDLTNFLKCRSEEMVLNGRVLLILQGRLAVDPAADSGHAWDVLTQAISNVISNGLVDQEKLDSFNVPYYIASREEAQDIIEKEGSFSIQRLEHLVLDPLEKGGCDAVVEGEKRAKNVRSFSEPLLSHQFGKEAMDPLYNEVTRLFTEGNNRGKILQALCPRYNPSAETRLIKLRKFYKVSYD